jgi:hypothetical protein
MSLLDNVIKGRTPKAPRVMIYGYEGVGKSTWAASAPNPIFIQTEDGLDNIDTSKFPVAKTWSEVVEQMNALVTEKHDFQTLVVDSVSGLERLIYTEVCRQFGVKNIEKVEIVAVLVHYRHLVYIHTHNRLVNTGTETTDIYRRCHARTIIGLIEIGSKGREFLDRCYVTVLQFYTSQRGR